MVKNRTWIILSFFIFFIVPGFSLQTAKEKQTKPRPIEIADILAWKHIDSLAFSDDGQWFAYSVTSRKGFRQMVIRKIKEKKEYRFPTDASGLSFSGDSRWVAFTIRPEEKETKRLLKEKKKAYNKVGLVNLASGEKIEFEKIQRFSFSGEKSTYLALYCYPPQTQEKEEKTSKGSSLILHELETSKELSIGNVSEFGFDKSGCWLAWIVDAWEQSGNGVQLRNMETGQILPLESDKAYYERLSWTEKGDGLTVLKGKEDKDYEGRLYSVIGFRNFSNGYPQKIEYEPLKDKNFPEGMTISPERKPELTEDLSGILFGIHKVKKKDESEAQSKVSEEESEELPDLVLWHWLDKRMQSQQQVEEKKDKEDSYLCVFWAKEKNFVRLTDEEVKEVIPAPKQRWAIGFDEREYEYLNNLTGLVFKDVYAIDMRTGARRLALKKYQIFSRPRWYYSFSPDGLYFLYYRDGHFFTYDLASGREFNISKDVPTSFINEENTYNVANPPIQPMGWSKDSTFVLLYDNWDVWKVPVKGGKAVNLTVNGKKSGIRYKRIYQINSEEKDIDLSSPLYFEAYGEWTKKAGIARLDQGKPGAKMLLWDDAVFPNLNKAKKSDTYLYSRETYNDYDFYVCDSFLQNGLRMTNITSQQEEFLWSSGVQLVDYVSQKGDKLQAALFLPADYQKGKCYPTIVVIYEKFSSWLNRYLGPGFGVLSNAFYNSQGYAILRPDIVNRIDDPALSALWCVVPAIEVAVATGIVDRDRLGLHGHSMGGWETALLITQTDLFKAAVAGAPLTDLISMYGSIYGSTGNSNAPILERSQGRFSKGYWENFDAFFRNSPVFFAHKVQTPLLIMHNDKDGAVDWNQGVEFFNVLRRLQKPVFMLQYKGEGHNLQKFPNQKDYTIRMKEFFDHYLLGRPAPKWLKQGVDHLQMEGHLKERAKNQK